MAPVRKESVESLCRSTHLVWVGVASIPCVKIIFICLQLRPLTCLAYSTCRRYLQCVWSSSRFLPEPECGRERCAWRALQICGLGTLQSLVIIALIYGDLKGSLCFFYIHSLRIWFMYRELHKVPRILDLEDEKDWITLFFNMVNCVRLFVTPWSVAHQAPLSMGFSRQEYWSGLPFPSPGDLPDPGIEPSLLCLRHWQMDSLPRAPPRKPYFVTLLPLWFLWWAVNKPKLSLH